MKVDWKGGNIWDRVKQEKEREKTGSAILRDRVLFINKLSLLFLTSAPSHTLFFLFPLFQ